MSTYLIENRCLSYYYYHIGNASNRLSLFLPSRHTKRTLCVVGSTGTRDFLVSTSEALRITTYQKVLHFPGLLHLLLLIAYFLSVLLFPASPHPYWTLLVPATLRSVPPEQTLANSGFPVLVVCSRPLHPHVRKEQVTGDLDPPCSKLTLAIDQKKR